MYELLVITTVCTAYYSVMDIPDEMLPVLMASSVLMRSATVMHAENVALVSSLSSPVLHNSLQQYVHAKQLQRQLRLKKAVHRCWCTTSYFENFEIVCISSVCLCSVASRLPCTYSSVLLASYIAQKSIADSMPL
jgi:hypothetical protein